ncbi:MAG: hypothetical protein LBI31_03630 [Zoogloeaceae bacterium]|nr:hypothetical protein [Zoogloeaceae bacterium]
MPKQPASATTPTRQTPANPDAALGLNDPDSKHAEPPKESIARRLQRVWQDNMNRFTVIKEWLAEQGVKLSELADVHLAESLMHGRFSSRAKDFSESVEKMTKRAKEAGFTLGQIGEFLHAQHAEERNLQVAKINPAFPDGGSGMTTAEAKAILAKASPELKKIADEFRAITEGTLQIQLDAGLIDQETVDAYKAAYSFYVPLKGGPDEQTPSGTGKRLSVGFQNKRALGHEKRNEAIIENIIQARQRALLLAEKNRVGQTLLQMALEIANPGILTINKPEKRQVLTRQTAFEVLHKGLVIGTFNTRADAEKFRRAAPNLMKDTPSHFTIRETSDPIVKMMAFSMPAENEAIVYVKGQKIRIQINDPLLAQAYTGSGTEALGSALKAGQALNRFLSSIYTGYAPEFLAKNVIRDFTTGIINITGEEGIGMAARAIGNYAGSFLDLLKYSSTGKASPIIADYRADGGNTGAAYLSDLERLGDELAETWDAAQGFVHHAKNRNAKGMYRAIKRNYFLPLFRFIEIMNEAGENAMRLSIYKSMRESGQSRKLAAAARKRNRNVHAER